MFSNVGCTAVKQFDIFQMFGMVKFMNQTAFMGRALGANQPFKILLSEDLSEISKAEGSFSNQRPLLSFFHKGALNV